MIKKKSESPVDNSLILKVISSTPFFSHPRVTITRSDSDADGVGEENWIGIADNGTVKLSNFVCNIKFYLNYSVIQKRYDFMKILKGIIFYPMLYLRGLLVSASKILSRFFLLGSFIFLVVFLCGGGNITIKAAMFFGFFGFIIFMLGHFYDRILLKINPTGNELTLLQ